MNQKNAFVDSLRDTLGAEMIVHLQNTYGWDARLVGGAVRDTLLGKEVTDWDIVAPVEPQLLAEALQTWVAPKRIQTYGLSHGVVTAKHYGHHITLAACRRDVLSVNQRHAQVEFCDDWAADAARRDFTCNAIYFDGEGLWDPYNGLDDISHCLVRFIGDPDQRISEDILRFWRFFRFWAHMGNGQDLDLSQHVAVLSRLSLERTRMEVKKILQGPYRDKVLEEIKRIGAAEYL